MSVDELTTAVAETQIRTEALLENQEQILERIKAHQDIIEEQREYISTLCDSLRIMNENIGKLTNMIMILNRQINCGADNGNS